MLGVSWPLNEFMAVLFIILNLTEISLAFCSTLCKQKEYSYIEESGRVSHNAAQSLWV